VADQRYPIRSYQRIFKPERRIYQIEGHRLPVPGGVPLRWLGYATAALLAVLALSGRSLVLSVLLALAAGGWGLAVGDRPAAALLGAAVVFACQVAGLVLAALDWPLRLLVMPALIATLLTQATPDGRPAHRYALSRLRLWLAPARRSLGRPLPAPGDRDAVAGELWAAVDEHAPVLRRGRVQGPAVAQFASAVLVRRARLRRRRLSARPLDRGRRRRGSVLDSLELAGSEVLEVRP
jgi:hypothetical protein